MSLITWNNSLQLGNKTIDTQHQKLVDLINELHDSMKAGKGKDQLGTTLTELVNYTVYHFQTEEKLFEQYGYPEKEGHKKIHTDLLQTAGKIKEDFDSGKIVLAMEVLDFLKKWLNDHILGSDKKSVNFLISKGIN
jgi:hemerythrin-like metal-binding protein